MKQSFGRNPDARELMLRNLAASVLLYESVITTEAKGRVIGPVIDRLIRIGQSSDAIAARRQLRAYLSDENAVAKVLQVLIPRYSQRSSGFTRRFRLPARLGDGAPQVIIQLVDTVLLEKTAQEAKATKSKTSKKVGEHSHE